MKADCLARCERPRHPLWMMWRWQATPRRQPIGERISSPQSLPEHVGDVQPWYTTTSGAQITATTVITRSA